jgi:Leucine-rich repeat (LRR) protein
MPPHTFPPPVPPFSPLFLQDGYDAMDLSDNEIVRLENFPVMRRLRVLVACNNRISRVSPSLAATLPSLETLVLSHNRIAALADLDALSGLKRVTVLSLVGNPVTRVPNYRLFTVYRFPALQLLDFARVRRKERLEAAKFFASKKGKAVLAEVAAARAAGGAGGAGAAAVGGGASSAAAAAAAVAAVAAARTTASSGAASASAPAADDGKLGSEESALLQKLLSEAKTHEDLEPIERALGDGTIRALLRSRMGGGGGGGGGGT